MGFIAGSIASAADPQPTADGSIANDTRAMPMQRIMESIMRGNGETQAQAQAKDVGGKQMDATKKMSVTMTANPDDPGNPLLHIKNATADIINQTQGSDLQKTYDAPKKNVEDAIAKMNAPPVPAGQFEADALRSVGYAPERTDRTATDLQTYGQDFRAQRDLGEPIFKAAIKAALMRTGAWDRDKIAETLDRNASAQNAAAFKAVAEPVISEQDRQARLDRSEATLRNTIRHQRDVEDRLNQTQADNEQKTVYTRQNAINKGIDYSLIDPGANNEGWHKAFDDQNDTGIPATPQQYAAIDRKASQDVNKAFLDYTDTKKDTFALGNQPTWEAAKAAFGHPLTPDQDQMGRARWQAAHTYAVRKAADDASMQDARSARLELLHYKIEHEGDVKPVPIGRGDIKDMPVSEILAHDPAKVKDFDGVLLQKEGLLRKEFQDATEKAAKARVDIKSINDTPAMQRRWGWETGLANAQFDAKTYGDHAGKAQAELAQIQAARAARKSGAPAAQAQPQFPPQTEAGITAYMATAKVDRATAITKLKAAGRLK